MLRFPWDLDSLPYVALEHIDDLPTCAALYFVRTAEEVLYVGITKNLHQRWGINFLGEWHEQMAELESIQGKKFLCWMPFAEGHSKKIQRLERQAIALYKPRLNRRDVSTGSILQDLRIRAGLTLSEVSARTSMRMSMLSKIEHKTRSLYAKEIRPLARALGCEVDAFFPEELD